MMMVPFAHAMMVMAIANADADGTNMDTDSVCQSRCGGNGHQAGDESRFEYIFHDQAFHFLSRPG
jgi:hypothetical protein